MPFHDPDVMAARSVRREVSARVPAWPRCALLCLAAFAASCAEQLEDPQLIAAAGYSVLIDTPIWTKGTPQTSPGARENYGMAALGGKVVLFGGRLSDGRNSDETWEWDGTNWTLRAPTTRPSARQPWQQMAAFAGSVLLFSGGGALDSQTWSWNGTNWTQLSPTTSPMPRSGGHMAELGGALYLFGGQGADGQALADTWRWNGSAWSNITPARGPSARAFASMAPLAGKLLLFGGAAGSGPRSNETWTFDGSSWTLSAPASSPAGRTLAALASLGPRAVLFGGQASTALADTWEWNGNAWSQLSPRGSPSARYATQLAAIGGKLVMFGGANLAETWSFGTIPLESNGTACSNGSTCASGVCRDGVCCDVACDGQCEACDLPLRLGTCSAVSGAPRGSRTACASDGSACGGACDGTRRAACAYPDGASVCRLGSCRDGTATLAAFCDGTGFCPALATRSCAPFTCAANSCLGDCGEDSDCAASSICEAGICTAKRRLGQACSNSSTCASGFCVDGVCCNGSCRGQCEACDSSGSIGTCAPVRGAPHAKRAACDGDGSACTGVCDGQRRDGCAFPGPETPCRSASCQDGVARLTTRCLGTGSCPALQEQLCAPYRCGLSLCAGDCQSSRDCRSDYYCSAGVCQPRLAAGTACGAGDQCQSDVCSDGYCCDRACDGQCEACNVSGRLGVCSPVSGAPHAGRPACAGSGTCAGSCDGVEPRACTYPNGAVTCTSPACEGGRATQAASCDGAGACEVAQQRDCAPYACAATSCSVECASSADCATGYVCEAEICKLPARLDPTMSDRDATGGAPDAGPVDAGEHPESADQDSDGDGIADRIERDEGDTDHDGIPDLLDPDDDGDSIPTASERGKGKRKNDLDRDGIPNYLDTDGDGDGVPDRKEAKGDADGDGIPDYRDPPHPGVAGGGLCSARPGPSGDPAGLWLVLAALAVLLARRRQLRAVGALCLVVLGWAQPTAAQSIRLDQYLTPLLADDGLFLNRPIALEAHSASALLVMDYANDPLVVELEQGISASERAQLVQHQMQAGLRLAYGVVDWVSVSFGLDLVAMMNGDSFVDPVSSATLAPADGPGFGDAVLAVRVVPLGDARSFGALGVTAQLGLPLAAATAYDQNLSGEDGVSFRSELSGEIRPGSFRFTVTAGALLRKGVEYFDEELRDMLTFGAGAGVRIGGSRFDMEILAEVFGATAFSDPFASSVTPVEALLGVRFRPGDMLRVGAAAGPGLHRGVGAPDFRALASVGIVTEPPRVLIEEVESPAEPDSDGDGLIDARDLCPQHAEDLDGTMDDDGCPELDNDADQIDDAHDQCPLQAEDADQFRDDDGCPEPDNDEDHLADPSDQCPLEAEDTDGFEDADGCPDPDNDGDGVPDATDQCPGVAGPAAYDGCASVRIVQGELKLAQPIEFTYDDAKILAASDPLLTNVRALLADNPQLQLIAVEGHSDDRDSPRSNQPLSASRAESVVWWLTQNGIAADRLQAWDCGKSRPIESNETPFGRQINRRVEFHILVPAADPPHETLGCTRTNTSKRRER